MKTHSNICRAAVTSLVAVIVLCCARAAGQAPINETGTGAKTHTLFMGADLSIERNSSLYRVEDVVGEVFVVAAGDRQIEVPANKGPINMKVEMALKLADTSATLEHFTAERAYTPANDPRRKFAREQPGTAGMTQSALAFGGVNTALTSMAGARAAQGAGASFGDAGAAGAQGNLDTAMKNWGSALNAEGSDLNSSAYFAGKLQEELAKKSFDAMEITFEVSADKPLNNPYVVIITTYHDRNAERGTGSTSIFAKALEPITANSRKIRIVQGGFPPGFELDKYQLHLYNYGKEVATNVAPKRVALTREEAFQYLLMEYVGSHKDATIPGGPLMGVLPADFHERLTSGDLARTFYVRVTKEGEAAETFVDKSCSQKAEDAYVVSVVKRIRFKPALEKGKPVDSVVPLKLDQLRL